MQPSTQQVWWGSELMWRGEYFLTGPRHFMGELFRAEAVNHKTPSGHRGDQTEYSRCKRCLSPTQPHIHRTRMPVKRVAIS
jgi:hypothetical protein